MPSLDNEYDNQLNIRMTNLLKQYANEFQDKSLEEKEQEIVLFNIFANNRGTD